MEYRNIPIFNRKYIDSIRGPHFPASYVTLPECIMDLGELDKFINPQKFAFLVLPDSP